MSVSKPVLETHSKAGLGGVIKIAIMAVGGQGGGVLTGWIASLARDEGYACQATSVAGVAQRTGATIYYIEMAKSGLGLPVFALAPSASDVDLVIAAEMMEAGRAIARGFVTPDKTTLIASSHRVLTVSEKSAPGDGIISASNVHAAAEIAAARFLSFDMERLAAKNGAVISASLFGAMAASGCLPFPKKSYEDAIRSGKTGVEPSLRAFNAGFEACSVIDSTAADAPSPILPVSEIAGPRHLRERWELLAAEVDGFAESARPLAKAGLRKVVEFMDLDYGEEYLERLALFAASDTGADDHALSKAAAKYIANAMAYDDVIRVADLKTRSSRARRIANEMGASSEHVVLITEFLHPRAEDIVGMLPAGLGRRIESDDRKLAWFSRWFAKGRRLRSDRLGSFVLLYVLGGLKRYRRRTLRHAVEQAHMDRWLTCALQVAARDAEFATEVLCCRRLIKGYSDTHSRGLSKFDRVLGMVEQIADRPDAASWVRHLRDAAFQDEGSERLDEVIETIEKMS